MLKPLAVLIIEDAESDAELTIRLLKKADYDLVYQQVETAAQMQAALDKRNWDVIISDYSMPQFDGHAALALLQATGKDIPFIVVSGTMGEETAVMMMKAGAHDYVMKDNLSRLLPAVERELEQAEVRRERKLANELIRRKDDLLHLTGEIARIGGWEFDARSFKGTWTDEVARIHGVDPNQATNVQIGTSFYHGESRKLIDRAIQEAVEHAVPYDLELEMVAADGQHKWVRTKGSPDIEGGVVVRVRGIFQDISERKEKEIQLQHHREDLELINTLNYLVNKGESFDVVVNTLARETRRLLNAKDCAVYLLSPDGKNITLFNRTLDSDRIGKIEQLIGRPIPAIQIPVRAGSYFKNVLDAEHGMVTSDPKLIQQWMAEFAETPWLPEIFRKPVRRVIPQILKLLDIGSIITIPLISEGKSIGMLDLSSQGMFSQEDLARMHKISGQVTAAILRKRDEEALRESKQKFEVLAEISPVGIIQTSAAGSVTYVNSRWSQITGVPVESALGDGWLNCVLAEDRANLSKTWIKAVHSRTAADGEFRYLRPDGRIIWVWYQVTPEKNSDGRVESFVGTVTDITEIKQAQQQIETQLRRLGALNEIDAAINTSLDLKVVLNILLEQTTRQLGVDAASVLLLDESGQALKFAAGRGFRTNIIESAHIPLRKSLAGQVVLKRSPFYTDDLVVIGAGILAEDFQKEENFAAYGGVPLIAKGEVIGVLEVFNHTPVSASAEWMTFMSTLAEQAAIAIDNARLFENLQHSNKELSLAYDATIEGWSRALDMRDKETEGHTLRVTQMSERMARALGMSDAELVHIRRGALLHDIGKLGVPDAILLKPDTLSSDEWVLMRKHPQFAYEMIAPIPYLRQALDIPHYHHEKWDGSGYPHGLKGEDIPLAARMFAVVDIWDALLSDRPYRPGWPEEKVMEHIRSLAGTHFDPKVVAVFLDVIHKMEAG